MSRRSATDDIGTMCAEVGGVIALSNAEHNSEPAGTSRFAAGEGVFKDDGTNRWSLEPPGRFQRRMSLSSS